MKSRIVVSRAAVLGVFLAVGAVSVPAGAVRAQNAVQPQASRAGTRPLPDVLSRIGQGAGVTVVTNAFPNDRVPLPTENATPENIERLLDGAVKSLPDGAMWVKLYLPPTPTGRAWSGEDAGAYAALQAKLLQRKGAPQPGTVEIMGQRLTAAEAGEVIARLKLSPVYLVTRSGSAAEGVPSMAVAGNMNEWMKMSPEQRWATAQNQAAQIMSADPAVQVQVFQQQAMVFGAVLQQMSPQQRQQVFAGMQQFFQQLNGAGLGPGGGGGDGNPPQGR